VVQSGAPASDITPNFDGGPGATTVNSTLVACAASLGSLGFSHSDYVSFTVGSKQYMPRLAANGATLAVFPEDVIPNFCVGQEVTFSSSFDPPLPVEPDVLFTLWWFSGTYVNARRMTEPTMSESDFPQCSYDYYINPDLQQCARTTNVWLSGGDGVHANVPAIYSAVCCQALYFPNGQQLRINIPMGSFNMYRPVATLTPVPGVVQVLPTGGGNAELSCGNPANVPGITIHYTITQPDIFQGTIFWVQVFTSTARNVLDDNDVNHVLRQFRHGPWLDDNTDNPAVAYNYTIFGNDGISPADSPDIPVESTDSRCSANESLLMTMMFTLPGSRVPVPIIAIPWSWFGSAVKDPSYGWQNNPSNHQITSGEVITAPEFPRWSSYWTDHDYYPPYQ
jgi:hypothetical protein